MNLPVLIVFFSVNDWTSFFHMDLEEVIENFISEDKQSKICVLIQWLKMFQLELTQCKYAY